MLESESTASGQLDPVQSEGPVSGAAQRFRFADAEFDEAQGVLRVKGLPVAVEPRPLRLLLELLRRPNVVVTKDKLFEQVWSGRVTVDHVLANAVSKLRAALGAQAGGCIVTVPRVGYRLDGPVRRVAQAHAQRNLVAGDLLPGREAFVLQRRLASTSGAEVWLARHDKLDHLRVFKLAQDCSRLPALNQEAAHSSLLRQLLGERDDLVQVLDTQFEALPFYLECSYGGNNLLVWSQARGGWADLTRPDRLDLFLRVARAIDAAHGVGVLHGGIRPSQLFVDGSPGQWQLRITGFGAGRSPPLAVISDSDVSVTPPTGADGTGRDAFVADMPYGAPELLQGHPPTVQSDVYALGLLLMQMLTGNLRHRLAPGWQREVIDDLLCEDICAATEGRPELRIRSVAELVGRLSHLEARRQALRQASARKQAVEHAAAELRRVQARRPWLLGAVGSLASGMVASVLFGLQTKSALQRATEQSARAEAVNDFLQEDFLTGIDVTAVGSGATVSVTQLLERASARAAECFAGQPGQEALVRGQLAGVFHVLSRFQRAEVEFRRALALADGAGLRADPKILKLRFDLVRNLSVHDKLPEARQLQLQAEADAGTLLKQDASLAQAALSAQVSVLISDQRFEEAALVGQRLVALADQGLNKSRPHEWFAARIMLGDTLYRLGRLQEADALLAGLLSSESRRSRVGDVTWSRAQVCLARVRHALGKSKEAQQDLEVARDVLLGRIGPDEHYVQIANAALASIFESRGEFVQAQATYQTVHDSFERAVGAQHPSTQVMALNLAITEINLGRPASALAVMDQRRDWFVRYAGGERGAVVQAIDFERARALTGVGQAARASLLLSSLDAKVIASAAPARDWRWRLQAETGRALAAAGQLQAGVAMIRTALPGLQHEGAADWVLRHYRGLVDAIDVPRKERSL